MDRNGGAARVLTCLRFAPGKTDQTHHPHTVTDATTNASFTTNFNQAIDIPGTVGGPIAYAGFTGGTGGLTAIQEIITWTYASSAPSAHSVTVNWAHATHAEGYRRPVSAFGDLLPSPSRRWGVQILS